MNGRGFDDRIEAISSSRGDNLALLYQGIIAVAGRVRSGEQPMGDVQAFRQHILKMREEVEKEALRRRYERRYLENATYAVMAFVDECVLSNDPGRAQWTPLHGGKTVAGEDFFKREEDLLKEPNSQQLADVLEVYLICLLLGYQGRYGKLTATGVIRSIAEELQSRINFIREPLKQFSPECISVPTDVAAAITIDPVLIGLRWGFVGLFLLAVMLWIVFRAHLGWQAGELIQKLT